MGGAATAFLTVTIGSQTPCTMSTPQEPRFWFELPNAPAPGTVLGARAALPDGQATMLALPDEFKVLLLRNGDAVHAFVNRCAHFGVPLAAKQEQLIFKSRISITCNVHYARYRWDDGVCEAGDCEGESLMPLPLEIDGHGTICIATP